MDSDRTLFVTDLDLTLLRSDKTVSARTVRIVNDLLDAGVRVTFATARSFDSSARATAGIRWRLPAATYGGTVIVDGASGAMRSAVMLPAGVAADVVAATKDHPTIEPILHTIEGGRDLLRFRPDHASRGSASFLAERVGDRRLAPVADWSDIDLSTAFYITIIGDEDDVRALAEELASPCGGQVHVLLAADPYRPSDHWLELHAAIGTKADAVRSIASELGADQLISFGDSPNDLPMFQISDRSFAVSNARPEVIAAATDLLGANDDDAVALWLEQHAR